MRESSLRYNSQGYAILIPEDDCDSVVDELVKTNYQEEFCLSPSFESEFLRRLIIAGFLVMSTGMHQASSAVLLPKLHLERAVIRSNNLHESRTTRRLLSRYELRVNSDFDQILSRCALVHGEDWLTRQLQESFLELHNQGSVEAFLPGSFALYKEGALVAGEFGFFVGGAYTSYSGFYDHSGAGNVQLLLSGRWLFDHGYTLWDLGMPMEYKTSLGAVGMNREEFIACFRAAREGDLIWK